MLSFGEMLPPVTLRAMQNPRYVLSSAAGRWVMLAFLPSVAHPGAEALAQALGPRRGRFNDDDAALFIISANAEDEAAGRLKDQLPGIRVLWDDAGEGARACRVNPAEGGLILLDPLLRVFTSLPLARAEEMMSLFAGLPAPGLHAGMEIPAPVLVLPRVFEPALCRHLIALYEKEGGQPSGFMREIDGKTKLVLDNTHKRRADMSISDPQLLAGIRGRLAARLLPALKAAFQFEATRIERYIVACYDAAEGGHFRAHRDNTTKGTAHRRFAVTMNLNAEDFSGGELWFPEFGPRRYRAPTGGAVVFSCSLLHEATPVTAGCRYAFLPFLYDEAGAKIREANKQFLDAGTPMPGGETPWVA
ncbi:2OG-Fe(II) oxygenase [Acetobacteraceae bacterium H6797]|nr:2OG-Fe(II) oxygenase [Acetobacteraceae bacterium H6797]